MWARFFGALLIGLKSHDLRLPRQPREHRSYSGQSELDKIVSVSMRAFLLLKLTAMFLFATHVCAAPPIILDRPDVRSAVAELRKETFQRGPSNLQIEYAILVRPVTSLYSLDWVSGYREDAYFPWDNQIIAVIHTHLNQGMEKPSRIDITEAKMHQTPIYVISASAIWVAEPTGESSCISCRVVKH